MDPKEELEALEKEYASVGGGKLYAYGKPIDEVTSGRLRGLVFRIRELDVERLREEGYTSIPQDTVVQFSDSEVIASIQRLPADVEWYVCRCGKCNAAFAGPGEESFEAERLIGAMFRYIKMHANTASTSVKD